MESVLCGKLDRIQRRATKTIKGAEELTYMGRLKALQICGLVKPTASRWKFLETGMQLRNPWSCLNLFLFVCLF